MSDHAAIKCTAVVRSLHVEELLLVDSVDEYQVAMLCWVGYELVYNVSASCPDFDRPDLWAVMVRTLLASKISQARHTPFRQLSTEPPIP